MRYIVLCTALFAATTAFSIHNNTLERNSDGRSLQSSWKEPCQEDTDCGETETCNSQNFCQCKKGYEGEDCSVITGCITLAGPCNKAGGQCIHDETTPEKAKCKCAKDDEVYDDGACKKPCQEDTNCGKTETCNSEKFCECKEGYEGEDCSVITGCITLAELCEIAGGVCIHDVTTPEKAKCKCAKDDQVYDDGACKNSKDCRCLNGRCVTDFRGKKKCACLPRYALTDPETCQPCHCGSQGKCIFTEQRQSDGSMHYTKKCICNKGFAAKDGVCVDCHCGPNSECEFEGDEKICYCEDGYAEKDRVCTECNCGEYGECKFEFGQKVCYCHPGYLVNGQYCEECDCGQHGECSFHNGTKVCKCVEGYQDDNGYCEECDCGKNSRGCRFNRGQKICDCDIDFAQYEDTCRECACGGHSIGCSFKDEEKFCNCHSGYVQKGERCEEGCGVHRDCQNGGICEDGFCKCNPGTSGEFCDSVDECNHLCAGNPEAKCIYDISLQKAICLCNDKDLSFDFKTKTCKIPCVHDSRCKNGGKCIYGFCGCNSGTSGDLCETVDDCENEKNPCGGAEQTECKFDVRSVKAVCTCQDNMKKFDATTKTCRIPCGYGVLCENGGECINGFCWCKPGTSGDLCKTVDDCGSEKNPCGGAEQTECKYDVRSRKAVCTCNDATKKFDVNTKTCRISCAYNSECANGGECRDSFCVCREGTSGNLCHNVDDCEKGLCRGVEDAACMYDVESSKARCICLDYKKDFDDRSRTCRITCAYDASCENGGECINDFCRCKPGTSGDLCKTVDDCENENNPCGGVKQTECKYDVASRKAVCTCQDDKKFDVATKTCRISCAYGVPCSNGGECRDGFCVCREGTSGDLCHIVDDCKKNLCRGVEDAECMYDIVSSKARCICLDRNKDFDDRSRTCRISCITNNCKNGAPCLDGFCYCWAGTSGDLCGIVDDCEDEENNPCRDAKEADCKYNAASLKAECVCQDDRKTFDENTETCRKSCASHSHCGEGGVCTETAVCDCKDGYEGEECDVVTGCKDMHDKCKWANATCVFDEAVPGKASCLCNKEKHIYNSNWEFCIPSCEYDIECGDGGMCSRNGWCVCKDGYEGYTCEVITGCKHLEETCWKADAKCVFDSKAPKKASCQCREENHVYDSFSATCKPSCESDSDCGAGGECNVKKRICMCKDGYEGGKCEVITGCKDMSEKCEIADATCVFDDTDPNKASCQCNQEKYAYDSDSDTCKKLECTEKTCFDGKCDVVDGEEVCSCFEGYFLEDDHCRKLNCSKTVCVNGTCVVRRGNKEECVCPAGFTLDKGVCKKGTCRIGTCYGGICKTVDEELVCVCPHGFHLDGIGCYETVCKINLCFGGKCVVKDNQEICTCKEGYILVNDVCKKILCEKKSCFGGQCHLVDGREECTCPAGYSIYEDVCRAD